jgi:hypothetical protein
MGWSSGSSLSFFLLPLSMELVRSAWNYEDRNVAQEVLPGVWLGPHVVGRDKHALRRMCITDIILVHDDSIEKKLLSQRFPDEFRYHDFPMGRMIVSTRFVQFNQLLDGVTGRDVLVLGLTGTNRSAALLTGFIMARHNQPFESALEYVLSHRRCVAISDILRQQLREFEPIMNSKAVSFQPTASRSKRRSCDDPEEIAELVVPFI